MPDAFCTRGLVCKMCEENAHEKTGTDGAIRPSLRNGFTVSFVLLCPQNVPECASGRFSQNRPSLDLSPSVLEGHRACRGAWDRPVSS